MYKLAGFLSWYYPFNSFLIIQSLVHLIYWKYIEIIILWFYIWPWIGMEACLIQIRSIHSIQKDWPGQTTDYHYSHRWRYFHIRVFVLWPWQIIWTPGAQGCDRRAIASNRDGPKTSLDENYNSFIMMSAFSSAWLDQIMIIMLHGNCVAPRIKPQPKDRPWWYRVQVPLKIESLCCFGPLGILGESLIWSCSGWNVMCAPDW